jgi:hypothetical protein
MRREDVLDQLLVWGLDDWAMAVDVAFLVKEFMGIEDQDARREPAIEVIRMAVEGGCMRLGDLLHEGRFTAWDLDDDAALERVRTEWEALGRPVNLYEVCWLQNTELGNERARRALEGGQQANVDRDASE